MEKPNLLSVVSLALALVSVAAPHAQEYYVAPDGADENPGSKERPFKTLVRARDAVRTVNGRMASEVTVYLRGGWYILASPLVLDHRDSGSNGHDIVYRAAEGEYPVVSGGRFIQGWSVHDKEKGIWKAAAPELKTRQLYVNCTRATRAHKGSGLAGARPKSRNGLPAMTSAAMAAMGLPITFATKGTVRLARGFTSST